MPGSKDIHSTIVPDVVARSIAAGLTNARNRGEQWQTHAEQFLGTAEHALKNIEKMRVHLLQSHVAATNAMSDMNETVLALLERLADAIWDETGQSPRDLFISIVSPGTPNFFFDWPIGLQVDRLEVMVDLVVADDAPWSNDSEVFAITRQIRDIIPQFRVLNETTRAFRDKLNVLDKSTEVVARVGHVQYSRLRQRMRAEGFDAFEVRKVFPDIPGASISGTLG